MSSTQHAIFQQLKRPICWQKSTHWLLFSSPDLFLCLDFTHWAIQAIQWLGAWIPISIKYDTVSTVFAGFWENYLIFITTAAKWNFKNGSFMFRLTGKKVNREATGKHFKASLRSFAKYRNCFKWRCTKIQVNTASVNWAVTGRLCLNFTFGATQRIKRVFQSRAEEGLEASFASGDEKMQMVRLKRGFLRVLEGWNERRGKTNVKFCIPAQMALTKWVNFN